MCIEFRYFMLGSEMGSLEVFMRNGSTKEDHSLFAISGSQGMLWHEGVVTIETLNADDRVSVSLSSSEAKNFSFNPNI